MLPPIPSPRIVPIDEGSTLWKPDNISEEPLIPPPHEFKIFENIQQVIDDLKKQDKFKKPISEPQSYKPTAKKYEGWSQAQIDQPLKHIIQIQALKDNPTPMLELSPLCHEGIIHDMDTVPFMY